MAQPDVTCAFSKQLVGILTQPVAVVDATGCILACNFEFGRAMSLPDGQYDGRDLSQGVLASCDVELFSLMHAARSGQHRRPKSVQLKLGQFYFSVDCLDHPDGQARYLCQLTPDLAIDSSRLQFLFEHLDQGVWNYIVPTSTFIVTPAWRRIRQIPQDAVINRPGKFAWWRKNIHPEDLNRIEHIFEAYLKSDVDDMVVQYRYRLNDGEWIWVLCRSKVMIRDGDGRPVQIVGLDTDITAFKREEIAQVEIANKLQLAIGVAGIGLWEFNSMTSQVHWDDRMLEIYGLTDNLNDRPDDLWESYLHPEDREQSVAKANLALTEGRDFISDYRIIRPSGEIRYVRSVARHIEVEGTPGKLLGVNIDITDDRKRQDALEQARAQLEYDSRHDALTGLANRRLLDETTAALTGQMGPDDAFAALHIDLDYFKRVNDTFGHAAGDQVLIRVANMLKQLVGDDGLVCRNGGDEFFVLLENKTDPDDIANLCQEMIEHMAEPMILNGAALEVGLSIGGAIAQGAEPDAAEVFINADVALYAAKAAGRSCFKMFEPSLRFMSQSDMSTYFNLSQALDDCEFDCHYQPQFDRGTLEVVGAEALVRWNCPQHGLLLPGAFMASAARSGLMPRMDEYVLDRVLSDQTRWYNAGLRVPTVALNVSMDRLMHPDLLVQLQAKLKPHHAIAFELLETAFLDEINDTIADVLRQVRAAGIRLDLDDFGSGHASVLALQALRPDRVKIDRMLISPLDDNPEQIHILDALVRVATLVDCGVVVEGIETVTQLQAVQQLDCEVLQGYLLSRPMSEECFAATLPTARTIAV